MGAPQNGKHLPLQPHTRTTASDLPTCLFLYPAARRCRDWTPLATNPAVGSGRIFPGCPSPSLGLPGLPLTPPQRPACAKEPQAADDVALASRGVVWGGRLAGELLFVRPLPAVTTCWESLFSLTYCPNIYGCTFKDSHEKMKYIQAIRVSVNSREEKN